MNRITVFFRMANAKLISEAYAVDASGGGCSHAPLRRPVDLLQSFVAERENFVIKPSDEYGGTGVMLGWETSESEWDKMIQTAVSSGVTGSGGGTSWIVQERIPIRREVFPYIPAPARWNCGICWWILRRICLRESCRDI